jgi:hypothetical protein
MTRDCSGTAISSIRCVTLSWRPIGSEIFGATEIAKVPSIGRRKVHAVDNQKSRVAQSGTYIFWLMSSLTSRSPSGAFYLRH